tara:strand:- start:455 stop:616 length:162 start_codon:yes stop_codon:yes gene_type:complete
MALKMDLKGTLFERNCDIILHIATWTVVRGQLSRYLGFFEKIKIKKKNILKQV